ncbi:MAG: hypothetical protein C5B51_19150 [Terriglobia bacterium]|nr:MAG: hypothetical protein C5B51_19150 [Terriglobia bacterium]
MTPMTQCQPATVPVHKAFDPVALFQIRRGYRANWNDLRFSVELDAEQWTLRVQGCSEERVLYSGRRGSLGAAKTAAAEFALFRQGGIGYCQSPEALAGRIEWKEYW